jgi:hypothetical protein
VKARFDTRRLLAAAALLLGSCVSKGTIGPNGFEQPVFRYRFAYQDPAHGLFLGPDWQLDNFFAEMGSFKAKRGPEYVATREIDEDGDGVITQWEKNEEPVYDLRFVNVHDDGIIWIKAHPLPAPQAQKDLDVILNGYADGLSGTGLYAQFNLFNLERVHARQFTSFVVYKGSATLANNPALVGVIELAESERLRFDPQYRSAKIKIAFARFAYHEPLGGLSKPWPVVKYQGKDRYRRIGLLVVGYYNSAAKFDGQVRAFDQALAQLSFDPESALGGIQAPLPPPPLPPPAPSSSAPRP